MKTSSSKHAATRVQPPSKRKHYQGLNPSDKVRAVLASRAGGPAVIGYMDHAAVHHVYLTDGLFRPIANGTRKSGTHVQGSYKLDNVLYQCSWDSSEALDVIDQSVLFALCQLGARSDCRTQLNPFEPTELALLAPLDFCGFTAYSSFVAVQTTPQALAKAVGLSATGNNTQQVRNSLQRLSGTIMRFKKTWEGVEKEGSTRIIGVTGTQDELTIFLNGELSQRCLEHKGVWINMREQRILQKTSKPAKKLHAFLSFWASTSSIKVIGLDKLPKHVWGAIPCSASAKKSRTRTILEALDHIAKLPGWTMVVDKERGQLKVKLPIFIGTAAACVPTHVRAMQAKSL